MSKMCDIFWNLTTVVNQISNLIWPIMQISLQQSGWQSQKLGPWPLSSVLSFCSLRIMWIVMLMF